MKKTTYESSEGASEEAVLPRVVERVRRKRMEETGIHLPPSNRN